MRHPESSRQADRRPRAGSGLLSRCLGALLALVALPALTGCEVDSWMDPSVLGRWEHTPTIVPVLDRIAVIERDDTAYVETSEVTPEDLIPVAAEYHITTGDGVVIRIRDYLRLGEEAEFERVVDRRGYIEIPRLAPVRIQGLTPVLAREALSRAIKQAGLLEDPTVSVVPSQQRQQTFSAMGSVQTPGTYFIPSPDYRLLQALTAAGGFSEGAEAVYVIRQIPLGEAAGTGAGLPGTGTGPTTGPTKQPEKTIDDIMKGLTPPKTVPPSPGVYSEPAGAAEHRAQPPATQPAKPDKPPPILLPDTEPKATPMPAQPATAQPGSQWMFINGQWVKVSQPAGEGEPAGKPVGNAPGDVLVAQRVIRVPTPALIAGSAKYNIVVRPGDIIRVPTHSDEFFYIAGQITRPGVYAIPRSGITLLRAIPAGGDLTGIAIPERVDLTRKVGSHQQATIRINLRAIAEGTDPDIDLKADDLINIGTTFWAYPLAVVRNGIRASYGYGFILDRNFGNDVFGAPPTNISGQ